jgi:hypothetical protein
MGNWALVVVDCSSGRLDLKVCPSDRVRAISYLCYGTSSITHSLSCVFITAVPNTKLCAWGEEALSLLPIDIIKKLRSPKKILNINTLQTAQVQTC